MSRGVFRGRGRGSYRGSSGGGFRGSSIRRGRGGENGFSPRGGRVNKWNVYGDSPRGSDRFRSSSRMDDSGYHRFASSMRRSQDEGSYRGRSEYRGYRGGGFGADKRGSFGSRLRDRQESDSYPFRKTVSSFRGRFISSRSIGRTRGGRISRGFRPDTSSLTSRKLAGLLSRTEEDLRRLRMSSTLKRIKDLEKQGKSEENIDWDTIEDDDDEVVEEEVETEVEESAEEETGEESPKKKRKTEDASEDKKKNESVEDGEEVEESPKKKVVKKVVKKKVVKKPVKKETPTKKKASKEKDEGENEADEEKTEKESEKKDGDTDEKSSDFKYECPRCQTTCLTERGYNKHLQGAKHKAAMQKLTVALRSKLTIMRIEQRSDQRLIDQRRSSRNLETIFCRICKLNFRCLASEHARSFRHLKMKKFLMPICRLCKVSCKSPMMYEHHVCDVAHLKKAAQREKERELYKDNFMVVDAVGSQDEESDKEGKDKSKADGEEKDEEGKKDGEKSPEKKKKNLEVEHGYEFCKQISVFFCDLCESYLPQACSAMEDTALSAHCRSRKHMDRFIQLKKYQRRSQWEKTEKLEEKKMEEKSKSSSGKEGKAAVNGVSADKSAKKKEKSDEKAPADDEKIWSALGDFLDQVEPSGKSSDDEEESGRRYDRFKDSELKDGAIEVEDE